MITLSEPTRSPVWFIESKKKWCSKCGCCCCCSGETNRVWLCMSYQITYWPIWEIYNWYHELSHNLYITLNVQNEFAKWICHMCGQVMIYLRLSGGITGMSGHLIGSSIVHMSKPLLGLVLEKIDRPLHFMFDNNDFFIPTITKCLGLEPVHPVNYSVGETR